MGYTEAHDPSVLRQYEGLIFTTAQRLSGRVEMDVEDIQQVLRIKVYRALLAYDPAKRRTRPVSREQAKTQRDRYVFMCLSDQVKDLHKKKKRGELFIEDVAGGGTDPANGDRGAGRDSFDERYLSSTHAQVYGDIDEDDLVIPNTLSPLERRVVVLLYRDFRQSEIARRLVLEKRDMERVMRSIRAKLADWQPASATVVAIKRAVTDAGLRAA